jgi:hypothetical protein
MDGYFKLKRIKYNCKFIRILCQNENGPCPLLAIANVLILKNTIALKTLSDKIKASYLVQELINYLKIEEEKWLQLNPILDEDSELEVERKRALMWRHREQLDCVSSLLPSLLYGLDVNVKFSNVDAFEYTQELSVFDAFNIRLFHGWCVNVDPFTQTDADAELCRIIRGRSYNELMNQLVAPFPNPSTEVSGICPHSSECIAISQFLECTASQLTEHGLKQLSSLEQGKQTLRIGDPAVLFRNNHFSVVFKCAGVTDSVARVLLLVTDEGFNTGSGNFNPYLTIAEENASCGIAGTEVSAVQLVSEHEALHIVVWEQLSEISGSVFNPMFLSVFLSFFLIALSVGIRNT